MMFLHFPIICAFIFGCSTVVSNKWQPQNYHTKCEKGQQVGIIDANAVPRCLPFEPPECQDVSFRKNFSNFQTFCHFWFPFYCIEVFGLICFKAANKTQHSIAK